MTVDILGVAGQRFVDAVVDDLVNHVVQARAVIGVADIHAGTLANGVEPAQHLDRVRRRTPLSLVSRRCPVLRLGVTSRSKSSLLRWLNGGRFETPSSQVFANDALSG